MINGFGVIAVLLIVLEIVLGFMLRAYCYQSVESVLSDRTEAHREFFAQYTSDADFDF